MTKKKKHPIRRIISLLAVILVLAGYSFWDLGQPIAALNPSLASFQLSLKTADPVLAWPSSGQSAVTLNTLNDVQVHGAQKPAPTASVAKVITALCVLKAKPLQTGQSGPTITLGPADVARYNSYVAQDGSVVPISDGEQVSEYQMLQAILLPSANNMADSLAIWAFGSLSAYRSYANAYLTSLGLHDTVVGSDASGFAPDTLSTAHDLVILGKQAMQNPVIAQIVGQSSASGIPGVDTITNVNSLLGVDGIVGIKTGNTDQAGGVFLSAAQSTIAGQNVIIITAYMGAPTLYEAMRDTVPLIQSAESNFKPVSILKQGAIVGSYRQPNGVVVNGVVAKNVDVTTWNGSTVTANINLSSVAFDAQAGHPVGTITVPATLLSPAQHVPINLQHTPTPPTTLWRLLHPGIHLKL